MQSSNPRQLCAHLLKCYDYFLNLSGFPKHFWPRLNSSNLVFQQFFARAMWINPILFGGRKGGGEGEGKNALPFDFFEISPKLLTKLTWNFQSLIFWLFESCSTKFVENRWRHIEKNPRNFCFRFFNNFSLFVISMLRLLVKTIFFENRC